MAPTEGDATASARPGGFVRSRKRFKAYTWKYKKTISPIASFVLVVNQMIGYGMSDIPSVMREGGWLYALLANLLVSVLAALCSLMLLRAMTLIPHNENFDHRIEYNTLVKYYLSDHNFRMVALLHHVGDLCSVICGILAFSKLVDMLLVRTLGWTLALQVYPDAHFGRVDIQTVTAIYESNVSSGADGQSFTLAITMGYVICAVLCLRLSACALEETMGFHVFSFLALIGCTMQLAVFGFARYLGGVPSSKPPAIGGRRFSKVILTFVENFNVASSTPSWANEMTSDVKVVRTMWTSTFFTSAIYHVLGYILCVGFPANSGSIVSDILLSNTSVLTHAAICLFVAVNVLPDVVFGTISTKYNLLNLGYCGSRLAYFWGCVLPFTFTWMLSNESLFFEYLGHIGLISALFCDFVIPVVVYKVANDSMADFMDASTGGYLEGRTNSDGSYYLGEASHAAEMLLKRGTSILFNKIGSISRAFTMDMRQKPITEDLLKSDSIRPEAFPYIARQQSDIDFGGIDFMKFKIIRPPPQPRPDDHLYNVIAPQRRSGRVVFDGLGLCEPDMYDETSSTPPQSERAARKQRVEVFPVQFLEKHSTLVTHLILSVLGGMIVIPMVSRFKLFTCEKQLTQRHLLLSLVTQ
ncbi:transmembrane amino acid transporter [Babesia ovata]|uniref:Transmembrane amino acid transporter n=1 Tax=Babesia ovata TaxID=189622 RepID=A0A2H6KEB6_9APIC|nr:transmembrane amino acid transporter [Babesia ovata]GBE61299.1 transmembrane amino acid transporter [Babesia ovata]